MARIHKLHRSLSRGDFPNFQKLAKELDVSPKTVQRDMDLMRDRLNLPIEYDQTHFGFFYREKVVEVPGLELTEGEVVALFIAQQALGQYSGTPFAASLKSACSRLAEDLQEKVSINLNDLDAMMSFRNVGENPSHLESFRIVSRALIDYTELKFEYFKIGGSGFEQRHVRPYHLGCYDNQWYLWAFDLHRKAIRNFALCRLRRPVSTRKRFKRPANFKIEDHLSDSFGVFRGTEEHLVRIWFDSFAARFVVEKKWHKSQKINHLKNGEIELQIKLNSLQEISRWVLSWGEHARALAPEVLIKQMANVATCLNGFYVEQAPTVPSSKAASGS
jgi:proteasome accessory factor B